jgi:hypothetical protein
MARPSVVLPQPLSPTRPSVSPGAMAKLTSSTAFTNSRARLNIPCFTGKCTFRFLTSSRLMVISKTGTAPNVPASTSTSSGISEHSGLGDRAARRETAAGREIADARDVAGNGRKPVGVAAQFRHGIHQRLRVGMQRAAQ